MKDHVLLVDDEPKTRAMVTDFLEEAGFQVWAVENSEQAYKILDQKVVDAVILDLVLGSEDGLEVLRRIKEKLPDLPVIILSGHGTIARAVEATRLGAYDFLEKPVKSSKIVLTVRNSIQQTRLRKQRDYLLHDMQKRYQMVGVSPAMKQIVEVIERVAPTDAIVLITGESGTGKELIARAIHLRSPRAGGPFLPVNCAALPEELVESELFGHEKGAFTGAHQRHFGKFEQASDGTLFLDEISEMSPRVQAKVLRAIEDGVIYRVGGRQAIPVHPRILAASNRDMEAEVRAQRFRSDLFYRLNVIHIHAPPLRERKEDIPPLVKHFLETITRERGLLPVHLHESAMEVLLEYTWPGNVRELRNLLEKLVILYSGEAVGRDTIFRVLYGRAEAEDLAATLADIRRQAEREALLRKLIATGWDYRRTARELNISRATLFNKMREYRIRRPHGRRSSPRSDTSEIQ